MVVFVPCPPPLLRPLAGRCGQAGRLRCAETVGTAQRANERVATAADAANRNAIELRVLNDANDTNDAEIQTRAARWLCATHTQRRMCCRIERESVSNWNQAHRIRDTLER